MPRFVATRCDGMRRAAIVTDNCTASYPRYARPPRKLPLTDRTPRYLAALLRNFLPTFTRFISGPLWIRGQDSSGGRDRGEEPPRRLQAVPDKPGWILFVPGLIRRRNKGARSSISAANEIDRVAEG